MFKDYHLNQFIFLVFRKLDGVHGLEPWNDRIKIYCLTNLAIPQHELNVLLN